MYRQNLRRQAGEDSPESSPDTEEAGSCDESNQQVNVAIETTDHNEDAGISLVTAQPIQFQETSEDKTSSLTPCATPETSFSDVSQSDISIDESPASAKKTKAKTRRGKRKREPSLEDIYQNKLWRTQMPKEKTWETIYEEPKENKRGGIELLSGRKFRRLCDMEDIPTQVLLNKYKKRRQKAKKRGWKPLSKAKDAKIERLVEEKIMALDCELMDLDTPNTSIAETLALLGDGEVAAAKMDTSCVSSPSKPPTRITVTAEIHEPKPSFKADNVKAIDSFSDWKESDEVVCAKKHGKKKMRGLESSLCAITEGSESDIFHSPKAENLQKDRVPEPHGAACPKTNAKTLSVPEQASVTSRSSQNESVFYTPRAVLSDNEDDQNSVTNRKKSKKAASAPSCDSIPEEEEVFYTPAKSVSEMAAYTSPAEMHSVPVATSEIDNSGIGKLPHSALPAGQGHKRDDSSQGSGNKEVGMSPNSSGESADSLALHKTARQEEVADISGVYTLSP